MLVIVMLIIFKLNPPSEGNMEATKLPMLGAASEGVVYRLFNAF